MSSLFGILFWAMMVVYALAVGAQLFGQMFRKPRWSRLATIGMLVAFAAHTALVAWRWIETGHVPTIGNFENALIGGLGRGRHDAVGRSPRALYRASPATARWRSHPPAPSRRSSGSRLRPAAPGRRRNPPAR